MRLAAFAILTVVLGGCSSTSFVGKRFDNFTAYYNTFYNARKSFDAATKSIRREDARVDRTTYMRVIDLGAGGSGGRDFENAIKKSADVLRKHPRSKWVDDALLLIGKSYYYSSNTVGAEQKFREVIQRQSGLEDEARFWLGLSLIASGALDEAGEHLRESIDREGVNRKWRAKMRAVLGELYVRKEQWKESEEALREATARIKDDHLGSRAQFLLGQVYETLGDYDAAVRAYRDVGRFHPLYEISYAAQFNAIRVEGIHGDRQEALKALRKMQRDDKHFQYRAELDYLHALIIQNTGEPLPAVAEYEELLYDSDANISTIRGQIHYQLGIIYRDLLPNFSLAAAYFDTAKTTLGTAQPRTAGATARDAVLEPAPGAITDAEEEAKVFGSYADFYRSVAKYDSLLYLGSLDDEAFAQRIEEIRRDRAEELLAERERQKSLRNQERFGRGGGFEDSGPGAPRTPATTATGTAGFLFHRDRSRVQENLVAFFDRWGDRPLAPNWRRNAAITGRADRSSVSGDGQAQAAAAAVPAGAATADAVLATVEVDVSAVPRTPEQIAAMRADRARARYELANVLFLSIELPDSAAAWYRSVVEEDPDLPVASRALYAIGEVQRTLGDTSSANAIYRRVVEEYPDSEVAGRAAERIGLRPVVEELVVEESRGDEDYEDAYAIWKGGRLERAARQMLSVAADYSGQEVAARSLLAMGAIYVDWADETQHDVLESVDMQVPDSLWKAVGLWKPDASYSARPDSDSAGRGLRDATSDSAARHGEVSGEKTQSADVPEDSLLVGTPNSVSVADSVRSRGARDSVVTADPVQAVDSVLTENPVQAVDSVLMENPVQAVDSVLTALPAGAGDAIETEANVDRRDSVDSRSATGVPGRPDRAAVPSPPKGAEKTTSVAEEGAAVPETTLPGLGTDTSINADTLRTEPVAGANDGELGGMAAPPRAPIYLDDVYALVSEQYADTEYGRVAKGLLDVLTARRAERKKAAAAAVDSMEHAVVAVDSTGHAAAVDTTGHAVVTVDSTGHAVVTVDSTGRAAADSSFLADNQEVSITDGEAGAATSDTTVAVPGRPGRGDEDLAKSRRREGLQPDVATVDRGVEEDRTVIAVADSVDQMPFAVGGEGALQRMVRYPADAKEADIRGTVTVSFVVDERGQVSDVKVDEGIGGGCDEEAMRVVRLMRYRPAMKDKTPVKFRMREYLEFGP